MIDMKKILYLLIVLVTFTACEEWLDVAPNTDVPAKELFTTENGFTSALAGLYIVMTDENTYGKNLTFGLVDQLAQLYDYMPDGTQDRNTIYIYDRETSGAYNTKGVLANTWQAQYHIIANANNLLKWWDLNGATVLTDETTRRMVRGEALALRAMLHFDLLRGWGPMEYANNPKAKSVKCMPYRIVADHEKMPLLPASDIVDNILKDLYEARSLMSYEKELDLSDPKNSRQYRLNYHAINALLARVYNYAGVKDSAALYATQVIKECGLSLQTSNYNDPILSQEVICGLSKHEMRDNLSDYFEAGEKVTTKYYLTLSTLNAIFETVGSESEDIRAQGTAFHRNNELQNAISLKYIDNDNEVIPLIRLPEMYYIACEATADANEAATYINLVRNKRGISKSKDVACDTKENRLNALNKEFRKEFYGEGQYFWYLKAHGIVGSLGHHPEVELVEERFVFPLPDAEVQYGWTEEEEAIEGDEKTGGEEGVIIPRV